MLLSELDHVTVLSVASFGLTVAVRVSDSPSVNVSSVLLSVTDVTAVTFLLTVTEQVADFSPALAVIVALPSFTAVTLPFASTVAMLLSELDHVTVLSVASSGFTVAVSVSESPSVNANSVLFSVTEVTTTTSLLTVTEQVADLSPAWAVIVTLPSFTAVTLPFASTVATVASDEDQVTVLSVASSGFTVAVRVSESPSVNVSSVLFSEIDMTTISLAAFAACSTVKDLLVDPHLMVTVALRALSVSFGSALTVILTVPAPPELGSTVSQDETLVSVTVALHDSVAVKVTVCV